MLLNFYLIQVLLLGIAIERYYYRGIIIYFINNLRLKNVAYNMESKKLVTITFSFYFL